MVRLRRLMVWIFAAILVSGWVKPIFFTAQGAPASLLAITSVSPDQADARLDTHLTISGSGFQFGAIIFVDNQALDQVFFQSSDELTALLPAGFSPGTYTIQVVNPDSSSVEKAAALEIVSTGSAWTSGGPYGGQVIQLALDPQDSSRLLAAASQAGLYRSSDGAATWHKILDDARISGLAVNPGNSQILIAALGQAGALRSRDGGTHWQTLTSEPAQAAYGGSPALLYMSAGAAVKVSADDGDSWQASATLSDVLVMTVNPANPMTAYAGTKNGLFKTADGGISWNQLPAPIPANAWVWVLGIDPVNPEHVYVAGRQDFKYALRSLDGGQHWESLDTSGLDLSMGVNHFNFSALGDRMYALSCNELYQSPDHGDSWTKLTSGLQDCGLNLAVDPASGAPKYLGGGDAGVFVTADGGISWQVSSQGLTALQPRALAASAIAPEQAYVGAESAGGYATRSGGLSWRAATILPTQVLAAGADPQNPCTGFLGGMGWVFKTSDCGISWTNTPLPQVGTAAGKTMAIAVDPFDSSKVYAGGLRPPAGGSGPNIGFLDFSANGGSSWLDRTSALEGAPVSQVAAIAFGPEPGRIYVATGGWSGGGVLSTSGYLYTSSNGGVNWKKVSVEITHAPIAAIAVDEKRSGHLYASLVWQQTGKNPISAIYETYNEGQDWQPLPITSAMREAGINALAIDPLNERILYAGSARAGLFYSLDGGNRWNHEPSLVGAAGVYCLDAKSSSSEPAQAYTLLYVCSTGGVLAGNQTLTAPDLASTAAAGGVYQRIFRWQKVYFPLIGQ